MAIYHLHVGFVSRSTGRSSVQSASYITGSDLYETRRDLKVSYKNRISDVKYVNTLIPSYAKDQIDLQNNDLNIWDLLENFEDKLIYSRYKSESARVKYCNSAQTAMTVVVALPHEFSLEQSKNLLEEFAKIRFVNRGLIVTLAIHGDEGNPHGHLQISRRAVNEMGEFSHIKDTDICSRQSLLTTRKLWADLANEHLEKHGFNDRITEKSFLDLGINLEASKHKGWYSDKLNSLDQPSRIIDENNLIFLENKQKLIKDPSIILDELNATKATFSQSDILKALQKRIGDDDKLISNLFAKVLEKAIVVGKDLDGKIRYTGKIYQETEQNLIKSLDHSFNRSNNFGSNMRSNLNFKPFIIKSLTGNLTKNFGRNLGSNLSYKPIDKIINKIDKDELSLFLEQKYNWFNEEQKQAIIGLTKDKSDDPISVLIGRAGAGKTTTLKAVSEFYQNYDQKKVIGTCLSAIASQYLSHDAGIDTRTLTSFLYIWNEFESASEKFLNFDTIMAEGLLKQLSWYRQLKNYQKFQLTKDHVLIVDEAGMIGVDQWNQLLKHVNKAQCKLIVVGDDHQFKPISAGDGFRLFQEKAQTNNCLYKLSNIQRQKQVWMQDCSKQLSELNINQALSTYEQNGNIIKTDKQNLSLDLALSYVEHYLNNDHHKDQKDKFELQNQPKGLALCSTNKIKDEINQEVRIQLKKHKILNHDVLHFNNKAFAINDKIIFLENNKKDIKIFDQNNQEIIGKGVQNGMIGYLSKVTSDHEHKKVLEINLENNHKIVFKIDAYNKFDHGYGVTCHKAQGQTLDFAVVAIDKMMDAKALYVALTRHKFDLKAFYAKEDFKDLKALEKHVSRFDHKDLISDYTIKPDNQIYFQNVQDYRMCVLDKVNLLKDGFHDDKKIDWKAYQTIHQKQLDLGKTILNDFSNHRLYLNQISLTKEMLEINLNLKKRKLSTIEQKAQMNVELYVNTALLARSIYNNMRKEVENPFNLKSHIDFQRWQDLRTERNNLAKNILEDYHIHKNFLKEYKNLGFSKQSLTNQVNYEEKSRQFLDKTPFKITNKIPTKNFTHNQTMEILKTKSEKSQPKTIYDYENLARLMDLDKRIPKMKPDFNQKTESIYKALNDIVAKDNKDYNHDDDLILRQQACYINLRLEQELPKKAFAKDIKILILEAQIFCNNPRNQLFQIQTKALEEFCKYRDHKNLNLNNITKDQISTNHIGNHISKDQNFTPNPTLKLLEDKTNQQILNQLKTTFAQEQNTYQQNKTKTLNLVELNKGFER